MKLVAPVTALQTDPFPDPLAVCVGISFWKRRGFRALSASGQRPRFARRAQEAVSIAKARGGVVAVWASREPSDLAPLAAAAAVAMVRIEDGFIRSTGLGSDFVLPASLVIDRRGIYYDPAQPSDLEVILATSPFPDALIARARRVVDLLDRRRITKYNLARLSAAIPPAAGRRSILVPGQVTDDRSVLLGGCGVTTNAALLEEVRRRNPDAFIYYKPHPDVEAGHRAGFLSDAEAIRHADVVLRDIGILEAMEQVDEIHTLTSLTGFEALLRGKPVTTYGQPFYAGWGLTTDVRPLARRTRRLTLDELAAGALILYPVYLNPFTAQRCEIEDVIDLLESGRRQTSTLIRLRRLQGRINAALTRLRAAIG
jgi:capsular polysaccharide export protein